MRSKERARAKKTKKKSASGKGGALARYNEMRDFGLTAEPSGEIHPSRTGHSFVVQKHDATRLHYDFRLELDGVLKSWAVPKGPSLSPKDRRLAVQTEDHPVDYRDFEGTIPHGEYGGGPVIVWDRGEWTPVGDPHAGLEKGRLEFELRGEKLHGRFMLVRLKDDDRGPNGTARSGPGKTNWLLMKRSDEHVLEGPGADIVNRLPKSILTGRTVEEVAEGVPATRMTKTKAKRAKAKLPAIGAVAPELATLVDAVPKGEDWVYEMKLDGYRALATLDDGEVTIATRNGKDWTDHFPEIAEALSHVRAKSALFDGEIASVLEDGRTDFQSLQNALSGSDRSRLVYFVFDLLFRDGVDLRGEPLSVRKEELRTLLAGEGPPLRLCDHIEGSGDVFFQEACRHGLEGIIAKRASAPYRSGRGKDWVKVKCQKQQELVVVGFTPPKGSRQGIGALLVAAHEDKKKALRYAGKVGTGFTQASLMQLAKRLGKIAVEAPKVEGAPRIRQATWVEPELVWEVRFTEWTKDGMLRHPTFLGLREDKPAREVVREREVHAPAPKKSGKPEAPRVLGVAVSHPERIVDPSSGLTKLELIQYNEAIAEPFLRYASKRPLMLVRCTDTFGAWGPRRPPPGYKKAPPSSCFVQKHSGRGLVDRIGIDAVNGEEVIYATTPREVIELAQQNVVELHGWGSRLPKPMHPDWIVFDLDPDEGLPFARVVEAAKQMRESLKGVGLESFVKTTGGKGLHVVVPLAAKDDWDVVRTFSQAVADAFAKQAPDRYVSTMSKAKRTGKIFVDWFRNAEGATAILPYSSRARAGATVALPVSWKDLVHVDPQEFTVRTVPKILARRRVDPWEDFLATKQRIPKG